MKKHLICIMIACFALSALAQPPHKGEKPTAEQLDKMKAHKVAFLTEKLSLSSEEAQNFWPIYNEKEEKLTALRKEMRAVKKDLKMDQMKDSEVESLINKHLEYRQQELDLEKEYIEKFKTALPIKKVAQVQKAEQQFHRELIKKLGDKKHPEMRQGPPPSKR